MIKKERLIPSRLAKRVHFDKDLIYSILDQAYFCTVAYIFEGRAFQLPIGFSRIDNQLYLHGSVGSSFLTALAEAGEVCISATLLDGMVLAKSAFNHSMNYRSVVLFSKARVVSDNEERTQSLIALTDKIVKGRWDDIRKPNEKEWRQTLVLAFSIEEASAKMRNANAIDDEEDMHLPIWSGVLTLCQSLGRLTPAHNVESIEVPEYLKKYEH